MKFDSLAMIETNGFVSALVAVDKMLSLGDVEYLKKEVISNGQVTLFIKGNSSELNQILDAGIIAAQNVGVVIASGIIPYPNSKIEKIIFESTTFENKSKKVKKDIKKVEEKIDTLFDLLDEETSFNNFMAEMGGSSPDLAGEVLLIKHHKQIEDVVEDEKNITNKNEDALDNNSKTDNNNVNDIVEIKEENPENNDELDGFQKESIEESNTEEIDFEGMSHLERLRAEAKSEIKNEIDGENRTLQLDEIKPLTNEVKDEQLILQSGTKGDVEENMESELNKMSVLELRKLARNKENFPIKGRDISKANRKVLLEYFNQL